MMAGLAVDHLPEAASSIQATRSQQKGTIYPGLLYAKVSTISRLDITREERANEGG
jgi:hypothetical protein